jgi:hypothetical protein
MDRKRLAEYIYRPNVQNKILGGYKGGYSLGLTSNPKNRNEVAISLRIEGDDENRVPPFIYWGPRKIPIIVSPNFKVPTPQGARVAPYSLVSKWVP